MTDCPARGIECYNCKMKGHYGKLCRGNEEKQQETSKSKPRDGKKFGRITRVDRVGTNNPAVSVKVTNPKTNKSHGWHDAVADTGAEACVAGLELLRKLGISKKSLQPAKTTMFSFSGKQEKCLGILLIQLENEHYKALVEVNICPQVSDNLILSLEVIKELGYVRPDFPQIIPPTKQADPGANAHWDPISISSTKLDKRWVLDDSATDAELKHMRENPQSNGHAKAAVKATKGLVRKTGCKRNLKDKASGLLEWRCTSKDHGCSPAQLLYGRSIRSRVPTSELALDRADPEVSARRKEQKDKATSHYDSRTRDLPELKPGQAVRIQDTKTKLWDTVGVVVRAEAKQRNYLIKVDTHVFIWRNRRYLRPVSGHCAELGELPSTLSPMLSTRGRRRQGEKKSVKFSLPEADVPSTSSPRRSKRKRKKPDRLGVQSA